jgi:signal transduction histidine kinase
MSLRVRLILLIVALVGFVAVALSALHLNSLVNSLAAAAIERSQLASQQVSSFLIDHINQQSEDYGAPTTLDETKSLWYGIISSDREISNMLERSMANSTSIVDIVEINVAGETGQILASSNPDRVGSTLTRFQDFGQWKSKPLTRRVSDLIARRPDYEVVSQMGIQGEAGQNTPIFTIQVVTSNILLRDALLPQLQTLAEVSGGSLLVTLFITVLVTNRILRPVKRIEQTIDRIAQGNYGDEEKREALAKEFAVVESKLNLLGQQFRGARQDATDLRHNVDELIERMASQLDVAARLAAISKLTSGVAHEIKNPLNAIALRLDLIRAKLDSSGVELSSDIANELDVLSKEVLRLDRVVKTFLDFSRPVEVNFKEVDLAAVTREVAVLMTPQARTVNIDLKVETPSEPALLRADADMIKQAVLNLVTNAMEAMKNGGPLVLRVGRADSSVVLEVVDSGPGIPAEMRDKVFQLYFTTKTRGSGIGLAMTYRAVQLHNGTIAFTSDEGQGTTFRLQFPATVHHA